MTVEASHSRQTSPTGSAARNRVTVSGLRPLCAWRLSDTTSSLLHRELQCRGAAPQASPHSFLGSERCSGSPVGPEHVTSPVSSAVPHMDTGQLRHAGSVAAMLMMLLLDLTNDVWMLPSPAGLSMESVDMRHVLKWRPLQSACNTTVLYWVQFQGEFELLVLNGSWLDAPECRPTPDTRCDLTLDLGSDSDYSLRVRALCGSRPSPWTELSRRFNRRHTVLTVPRMEVTSLGDALQVQFERLPVTAVVKVTVWRRGYEQQPAVYTTLAGQTVLHVAAHQEGAEYCVRAQTVLDSQLYSRSTDTQCVTIAGPDAAWRSPTAVTVTVVVMVTLLVAVSCSVVRCRPDAWRLHFQKEPLPRSLQSDWNIQISTYSEEAEHAEPVQVDSED